MIIKIIKKHGALIASWKIIEYDQDGPNLTHSSIRVIKEEVDNFKHQASQTNMETRIDRIARYIEEFTKGMLKLKESQKKTIKKLDDIGANLGKMGIVQGEVTEELFYQHD